MREYSSSILTTLLVSTTAVTAEAADLLVPDDYATIQQAIADAQAGDRVLVSPGTYDEALDLLGKAITLTGVGGAPSTIVDASGLASSVVSCVSGEGPDTVIEGFTLTGGSGTEQAFRRMGGGMFTDQSSPTVRYCIFIDNAVSAYEFEYKGSGGGMYNLQSSPTVIGCVFQENQLLGCSGWLNGGAGMYNDQASPLVIDCQFLGNGGNNGAGMMNVGGSSPVITSCFFDANCAQYSGGAINNTNDSSADITNCVFRRNSAWHGGAVYLTESTATLTNCTFNRNVARWRAAGVYALSCSDPGSMTNCILWDDRLEQEPSSSGEPPPGPEQKEIAADFGSAPVVRHCIVQLGWPGVGNSGQDPQFLSPASGNLRLAQGSPGLDAGDDDAVPSDALDIDDDGSTGEPCPDRDLHTRITGGGVDLGAYEDQSDATVDADVTGDGEVDVEDLIAVVMAWGPCQAGVSCPADISGDGVVDGDDLIAVLVAW